MSNAIFPTLPGQKIEVTASPTFSTKTQRSVSGRELRAAFMAYPLWTFSVAYEFLRDTAAYPELDTLTGFFLARRGSFDSFLFKHPADNTAVDMPFAVGDGSTKSFQLTRALGAGGHSFTEPVQNVAAVTNIKASGVAVTGYTVGSTGMVTFTTAPSAGATLTWSGSFYYRCRFTKDVQDYSRFLADLWDAKKVEMVGAPGNKV